MELVGIRCVSNKQIKNNDNNIDYHIGFGKITLCKVCKQEVFINENEDLCICDNCNSLVFNK